MARKPTPMPDDAIRQLIVQTMTARSNAGKKVDAASIAFDVAVEVRRRLLREPKDTASSLANLVEKVRQQRLGR